MSELPWLKNKKSGGGAPLERMADSTNPEKEMDLSDHVIDELWDSIKKQDKNLFKEAFKALVLQIQDEDREQDMGEMS